VKGRGVDLISQKKKDRGNKYPKEERIRTRGPDPVQEQRIKRVVNNARHLSSIWWMFYWERFGREKESSSCCSPKKKRGLR